MTTNPKVLVDTSNWMSVLALMMHWLAAYATKLVVAVWLRVSESVHPMSSLAHIARFKMTLWHISTFFHTLSACSLGWLPFPAGSVEDVSNYLR